MTYSMDLEPKSLKESLYSGLSMKSRSTIPFSTKGVENDETDEVEILKRKKKELLKIQEYVEDSLKDIYWQIKTTDNIKEEVKEHRRNKAVTGSKPSLSKKSKNWTTKSSKYLKINCENRETSDSKLNTMRRRKPKKKILNKIDTIKSTKETRNKMNFRHFHQDFPKN